MGMAQDVEVAQDDIRSVVLGYLIHHCHASTASLFARESALFLQDAHVVVGDGASGHGRNGDGSGDGAGAALGGELVAKCHRNNMALRKEICEAIRSGDISYGAKLCNLHYPSVLLPPLAREPVFGQLPESLLNGIRTAREQEEGDEGMAEGVEAMEQHVYARLFTQRIPSSHWKERAATSALPTSGPRLHPLRLGLEIYTQLFIESNRTTTPSMEMSISSMDSSAPSESSLSNVGYGGSAGAGITQLARLDDLHRYAHQYLSQQAFNSEPNINTLRAEFMAQVNQVSSIIAYPNPERSPCARWMDEARRTKLAEDINDAICLHTQTLEPRSSLEQAARQLTVVRKILCAEGVRELHPDDGDGKKTLPKIFKTFDLSTYVQPTL